MKLLVRTFLWWLPLGVAVTGICLLVYATVQQNYRQSLNDPQVQMAEDGARLLAQSKAPAALIDRNQPLIDIAQSLAPWIAVYDEQGLPLESSGVLDGAPPKVPQGILDAAKSGTGKDTSMPNENRVTWESVSGTRSATVTVWVPEMKEFVVAGRNMREVENREGQLSMFVGLAWLVLVVATFAVKAFAKYIS